MGCNNIMHVTIESNDIMSKGYTSSFNMNTIFGSQVREYSIGDEVTSIGNYAFYGCTGMKTMTIPKNVTSIGNYAFYNTKLKSMTIGSGVQNISANAFSSVSKPVKMFWLTNTPPTGYSNAGGEVNYVPNSQYNTLNKTVVYPFLSSAFEVDGVKYVPVSPSERTCDVIDCSYDEKVENVNILEEQPEEQILR